MSSKEQLGGYDSTDSTSSQPLGRASTREAATEDDSTTTKTTETEMGEVGEGREQELEGDGYMIQLQVNMSSTTHPYLLIYLTLYAPAV